VDGLVPEVEHRVAGGVRLKDAVTEVSAASGVAKKALYDAVVATRRGG
jgi:16S rRNA (cytidine1402-2'-O)-methyltransferase